MRNWLLSAKDVQACIDAGFRGRLIGHSSGGLELFEIRWKGDFLADGGRDSHGFSVVEGYWLPAPALRKVRVADSLRVLVVVRDGHVNRLALCTFSPVRVDGYLDLTNSLMEIADGRTRFIYLDHVRAWRPVSIPAALRVKS